VAKKKAEAAPVEQAGPFNPAFAGLAKLRASVAENAPREPAAPAPAPVATQPAPAPLGDKVVVQRERKGHGGKTMVRVSGLKPRGAALEEVAKQMRRALGCGSVVEDDCVLVQGDQPQRVADWLGKNGARKVVIGN
jgi:translation initiation factor 1